MLEKHVETPNIWRFPKSWEVPPKSSICLSEFPFFSSCWGTPLNGNPDILLLGKTSKNCGPVWSIVVEWREPDISTKQWDTSVVSTCWATLVKNLNNIPQHHKWYGAGNHFFCRWYTIYSHSPNNLGIINDQQIPEIPIRWKRNSWWSHWYPQFE